MLGSRYSLKNRKSRHVLQSLKKSSRSLQMSAVHRHFLESAFLQIYPNYLRLPFSSLPRPSPLTGLDVPYALRCLNPGCMCFVERLHLLYPSPFPILSPRLCFRANTKQNSLSPSTLRHNPLSFSSLALAPSFPSFRPFHSLPPSSYRRAD